MLNSKAEALNLLDKLDAPSHLKKHVELVGEAADLIILKLEELSVAFDSEFVRVGVIIHDVGKIKNPQEMTGKGSQHETDGEQLLLCFGVARKVARVCISHARFGEMECSFEELLIALSDKLWKGKRVEALELRVIDLVAEKLGKDRWDVFADLDQCFESIAADGGLRLARSVDY